MLWLWLLNFSFWILRAAAAQQPQAVVKEATSVDQPLERLRLFIETNSHRRKNRRPLYTEKLIQDNVFIPQYDKVLQDYEGSPYLDKYYTSFETAALRFIEDAEGYANQETYVYLADLYMFGQADIRVNYTKALHYYEQAVKSSAHGHAYFMLGFIYSTGMFGEIKKIKQNLIYIISLLARTAI